MSQEEKAEVVQSSALSFLEALYGDPLRPETTRTGRHLLLASVVSILVLHFGVSLKSSALIPVEFGSAPDVLPMLLSLAVLFFLVSFVTRAWIDLLRDHEAAILVTRYIEGERVKAADAAARAVDDQGPDYEDEGREPDPWWEAALEIQEQADKAVSKAEGRVGIRKLPRRLRQARKCLEVGVPTVSGFIAVILSKSHLSTFVVALFSEFRP